MKINENIPLLKISEMSNGDNGPNQQVTIQQSLHRLVKLVNYRKILFLKSEFQSDLENVLMLHVTLNNHKSHYFI